MAWEQKRYMLSSLVLAPEVFQEPFHTISSLAGQLRADGPVQEAEAQSRDGGDTSLKNPRITRVWNHPLKNKDWKKSKK